MAIFIFNFIFQCRIIALENLFRIRDTPTSIPEMTPRPKSKIKTRVFPTAVFFDVLSIMVTLHETANQQYEVSSPVSSVQRKSKQQDARRGKK